MSDTLKMLPKYEEYIVYMNNWTESEAIKFWNKYYAEILKTVNAPSKI